MEDVDKIRVSPRDWFVPADAVELALERTGVVEIVAADDFDGAQRTEPRVPRKPDFAVSSATNDMEEFVIGNRRR